MSGKKSFVNTAETEEPPRPESLKVLIVGGREAIDESNQILESLAPMGYELNLVGVVYVGPDDLPEQNPADPPLPLFKDYETAVGQDDLDLIIITSDDHQLRQDLMKIISPETRLIDSFALKALRTLKRLSGKLGSTQEKLKSVELVKEVLMQGSEVSIMEVDEDFKVLDINNAILKRTKMSKEGCVGRECHWVIYRSMDACHLKGESCVVLEVLRTGRSTHNVREERRRDGKVRYFTRSAYPLKADEQGKRSVLIVWKDVTGGMAPVLDRQVRNIRENFGYFLHQDKMIALGKLAAAAVHEINNPIQGILTFSKLMRSSLNGETLPAEEIAKFRTYLDLIADESARCGHILRNLLSFARQGELRKSWFDLKPLLEEILLLIGNRMELQHISVCYDVDDTASQIYGDRNQIKQAILNLLFNAIDAMPGGGLVHLCAEHEPDADSVTISVTDTGPGVPKELESSVFEPFVTTKRNGKGVGLGLSVVYGIVSQHGGTVRLQSEEGKGATFVLTLPVIRETPNEKVC